MGNVGKKIKRLGVLLAIVITLLIMAGGHRFFESGSPQAYASAKYIVPVSKRIDVNIDAGWKFRLGDVAGGENVALSDASWTNVNLPHTWNKLDGQNGSNYYRGNAWYRKHYSVDKAYNDRKMYLQFDGSNVVSDVYVNGNLLGEHKGGYATFRFDATPYMHIGADNIVAVKVNNDFNADIAPLSGDYTFFGGIYRDVHLIVTDNVHLRMTDYGASGLYINQSHVSAVSANVQITAKTWNDSKAVQNVTLKSSIVDAKMNVVATITSQQMLAVRGGADFVQGTMMMQPHLWNGRLDPYLYQVYVEVVVGNVVVDLVRQPLGLRSYSLDARQGFRLNGKYLDLHGVNMQGQERPDKGWAISKGDLEQDFGFVQEIGATAIRMAHYQHDQHIYDLADSNGIIIWAEIPLINNVTNSANFTNTTEQQLIELIRQNYNHPSIIFWSLANELSYPPDPNTLLGQLNALAHQEDPARLTTQAVDIAETDPIVGKTDTRGYNKYFGWYNGGASDFDSWATNLHKNNPGLTFAVSEYGAGASIYQHQSNPAQPVADSYLHPEEYQAQLHETIWQSMVSKPYIWGKFVWNMFDFASASRNEGDVRGHNDKGLVTYDRQTRKDAFYWYKANWSASPFVYITDRRYVQRTVPTTDIKVYANTNSVKLLLNGVSLGSKSSMNHIFSWKGVTLGNGNNTIQALGMQNSHTYNDTVVWNYAPNIYINAGARMPYTDSARHVFEVDHGYDAGIVGSTTATIAGTSEQAEFKSYREGKFSYSIPIVNGNYVLSLRFMEPSKRSCGARIFSVTVQGSMLLKNEDIFCEVGQNKALQKELPVTVSNGLLTLSFTPGVDQALVSAIVLVKQ